MDAERRLSNAPNPPALSPGAAIGPYHVCEAIGAGGMGEVYRARDSRLGRDVALKLLPPAFTAEPDRIARFEREARVLASLNHPHIGAIYGLEDTPAGRVLVLELVEGRTLADRLRHGAALPVQEALGIARQMAAALEAAHEAGVVHRDVKPANIKVRPDGTVKVLDFGLAKALEPAGDLSASPTLSAAGTRAGVILGTAAYMSPEQARGEPVDRRTDIWAFGCVLYEMLTGRRAFPGATLSETLAAVIHDEPRWEALPPGVPTFAAAFLRRCLRKDPGQRVRDVGDLRLALEGAFDAGPTTAPPQIRRPLAWTAAAVALAALAAGAAGWTLKPSSERPVARLSHVLPRDAPLGNFGRPLMAVAPDGRAIVYVMRDRLYRRALGELTAVPIRGSDGTPAAPFFSPDGQHIGYWDAGARELRRIATAGGVPLSLTRATSVYGASWEADDTILYGQDDGIWRLPAKGGSPEHLVRIEPTELVYGPRLLPDRKGLLFSLVKRSSMIGQATAWDSAQIMVQPIGGGERKTVTRGADARYLPTGHLLYALNTALFAVPFDPARQEVKGAPVPVIEGVQRSIRGSAGQGGSANYDVGKEGTLAYVPAFVDLRNVPRHLLGVDLAGNAEPLIADQRNYWRPRISPDGTRVAVEVLGSRQNTDLDVQLWIVDLERGTSTPLTAAGMNNYVVWTADGHSIIFARLTGESAGLYQQALDGTSPARLLFASPHVRPMDVSRDGVVAFAVGSPHEDIRTMQLGGTRVSDFVSTPAKEQMARFSPDGKWLAYTSNESGQDEVYVRPFPPTAGAAIPVSAGGGNAPVWAPDGSALYYAAVSGEIMAVPTTFSPTFTARRPQPVFRFASQYRMSGTATAYDIHPDGKRFIMVSEPERAEDTTAQIHVVLNWFEELERIVPPGR